MKTQSDPQRVADLVAALRADREARRSAFRRDWPMHVLSFFSETGMGFVLGVVLALSIDIWLLHELLK